jgi:hypothetical protein
MASVPTSASCINSLLWALETIAEDDIMRRFPADSIRRFAADHAATIRRCIADGTPVPAFMYPDAPAGERPLGCGQHLKRRY